MTPKQAAAQTATKPARPSKRNGDPVKTGARILVEEMEKLGVEFIFGYPGGANLPIYDELTDTTIKVILSGDERCAGHSAEGYARATGKTGVCLVTSGPGATNLVTPLMDAKMDSTPIVGISGQVKSPAIGKDAFQETAIQTVTIPITKHNYLVTKVGDIGRVIREAFYVAASGRPGPVLVDVAKDAQEDKANVHEVSYDFKLRGYSPDRKLNHAQVDQAMELLSTAKKPLMYVGQGVVLADACGELRKFAEASGIPVTHTLMGVGAFPASHILYAGSLGMHGSAYGNYAIHEADVVLALGARFDDRVTGKPGAFATQAKFIHVDVDPSEINKNVAAHVAVTGNVKEVLAEMAKRAKMGHYGAWYDRIEELKRKFPFKYKPGNGEIKPQYFLERLWHATEGKAILTTGVGQHQMWAFQYYKFDHPRNFITSGGAGTMGFGLPAAIGAQFGRPGELVIDIDGDGSFEMNINDMRTVMDNNLPVKVVILNNKMLGMVGQWQRKFYAGNYSSVEFAEKFPDFSAGLKALYGIPGRRIMRRDEVDGAIAEMIKTDGPYVLDVSIPKDEDVYPMIPGGATIQDMILGEEQGHTPPI